MWLYLHCEKNAHTNTPKHNVIIHASSTVTERHNINQREKRKLKASLLRRLPSTMVHRRKKQKNYLIETIIMMCVCVSVWVPVCKRGWGMSTVPVVCTIFPKRIFTCGCGYACNLEETNYASDTIAEHFQHIWCVIVCSWTVWHQVRTFQYSLYWN